jgi:broad specificity phosphatase PhoE
MTGGPASGPRARLIRHAQASWGSEDYDRLSELGHLQARHLGAWLAAETALFSQIVRGSLRRHAETLAAIAAAFATAGRMLPEARIDPGWNEFDHEPILAAYAVAHAGDANLPIARGGDQRAQRAVLAAAIRAWHAGEFDDAVPETWAQFGRRVAAARERIGAGDGDVLIVTSGGAMWRCVQAAQDLDDAALLKLGLTLRNTGICDFQRHGARWHMLSWNELPHLPAPEHESLHTHY